jgi:hypothetical protein
MPPAKEAQPSPSEMAALAAWIKAGASERGFGAASVASAAKTDAAPGSEPAARPESPAASELPSTAAKSPSAGATSELPPRVALFRDAVQPLLAEKCGKCHIKDKPAGGLNVATHAQLLEGGFSGAALVPGDRKASVLMQRIVLPASDGDHMPPDDEPALSADEIELIGAFIDRGAPASGSSETAALTPGAQRALAARNVPASDEPAAAEPKGNVVSASGGTGPVAAAGQTPPRVSARAGGCAACSVPGAPRSALLGLQALALFGVGVALVSRRARRSRCGSVQARRARASCSR